LRDFIIDIVSAKKDILVASLGVVELTIALHMYSTHRYWFGCGHQATDAKFGTGRQKFDTNRQLNGISAS
jgi:1-deoxy-D-xylulose-5-phosphate synthase